MGKENRKKVKETRLQLETEWDRFYECKKKCEGKIEANWYHIEQQINIQLGKKPEINPKFGEKKLLLSMEQQIYSLGIKIIKKINTCI